MATVVLSCRRRLAARRPASVSAAQTPAKPEPRLPPTGLADGARSRPAVDTGTPAAATRMQLGNAGAAVDGHRRARHGQSDRRLRRARAARLGPAASSTDCAKTVGADHGDNKAPRGDDCAKATHHRQREAAGQAAPAAPSARASATAERPADAG